MRELLTKNLVYKVVAIFLALVLWFNATDQTNPLEEKVINVPLEVRGLPSSMAASDLPSVVQVRVEGRSGIIKDVSSKDFHALIRLEEPSEGPCEAPVEVTVPTGLRLVSVNPSKVVVQVAGMGQSQLPVTVDVEGQVAPGYMALKPMVEPAEVLVNGPVDLLPGVTAATVKATLNNEHDAYQKTLPVVLSGEAITNGDYQFTVSPVAVKVFIPVVMASNFKTVPVDAKLKGEPAAGYKVTRVVVDPKEVQVYGTADALKTIRSISTREIDITGIDSDTYANAGLEVPANVDVSMQVEADVFIEVQKK